MLLILVSLCGLISCVSQHKHLLVHLSCHSITKTKLGPFSLLLEVHLGRLARGGGARVDVHRRRGGLVAKPYDSLGLGGFAW